MTNDILNTVNKLTTNKFHDKNLKSKLYVIHYLFSSYLILKNDDFLDFAIVLLKETMSDLIREKKYNELGITIDYTICITTFFRIDLEIQDLIVETNNNIIINNERNDYLFNHLKISHRKYKLNNEINNSNNSLLMLLINIKEKKINRQNFTEIILLLDKKIKTIKSDSSILLLCKALIEYIYLRKKNHILIKEESIYKEILSNIFRKNISLDNDIYKLFNQIKSKKHFLQVFILYKFFINE